MKYTTKYSILILVLFFPGFAIYAIGQIDTTINYYNPANIKKIDKEGSGSAKKNERDYNPLKNDSIHNFYMENELIDYDFFEQYHSDSYINRRKKWIRHEIPGIDEQPLIKFGFDFYVQTGWYRGDLSNYFTHYNAWSFLSAHFSLYKFYTSATVSIGGSQTHENIMTDYITSQANHFTSMSIFTISAGYPIYRSKVIEIIPYLDYRWQNNSLYKYRHRLYEEDLGDVNHCGPGVGSIIDIIFSNKSWSLNQWAVRFKYEISFSSENKSKDRVAGVVNHLSIGLVYTKSSDY